MNFGNVERPPALRPGDTIGIAAPASCFSSEAFSKGVDWLEEKGFKVAFREDIFSRDGYLAGPIERRLAELNQLIESDECRALMFARGGYGSMQLLPEINLLGLLSKPKIIIGHSDLTPLLNLVTARLSLLTFHGPLVAGFHKTEAESLEQMLSILGNTLEPPAPISSRDVKIFGSGRVVGPICGGSLTLIAATMGTPFEIETGGRILCLEEVGEKPYRVDRLLQQLELGGKLEAAAGIVVGHLIDCESPDGRDDLLEKVFDRFFSRLTCPVIMGLPFGHGPDNYTLPIGAIAELDAHQGILRFPTPVVS